MELILPDKKYLSDYIKAFEEFEEKNENLYLVGHYKESDLTKYYYALSFEGNELKLEKIP